MINNQINDLIKVYDEREKEEEKKISFIERSSLEPIVLMQLRSYFKINGFDELSNCCDNEHDYRGKKIIDDQCNGFTDEELNYFIKILNRIDEYNSSWNNKFIPITSLITHIYHNSVINLFAQATKTIL